MTQCPKYTITVGLLNVYCRLNLTCIVPVCLLTRVGISGTTAKSRQRKFVPSSHPGSFALVASSHKSQTKVGILACFDFL